MNAHPDVLERVFPAPEDAFERLSQRRDRHDRNRRIADGALAIGLVVALVAALLGAVSRQQRHRPAGPITPSNIADLGLSWWGSTTQPADSQPTVADGRIYVVSSDGTLSAFSTTCGSDECPPLWSSTQGVGSMTAWGSAIVFDGRVYQPSSDGRLVGYPTSCSADPCEPDWVGRAPGNLTSADPAAANGTLFVAANECCHGSRSYGHLFAFAESCGTYPRACRPVWRATLSGGFQGGQPIVAGDRVYVGSKDGTVYAFPTECDAVRGRCAPVWIARTNGPINSDPKATQFGWSRIVAPLVVGGSTLFVPSGAWVYAFPLSCNASPCQPSWIARSDGGYVNDVAATHDYVYVSAVPDAGDGGAVFPGETAVYPAACSFRCEPAWIHAGIVSSPTVVDGVAYLLAAPGSQAFDATCGTDGGECRPLWTMSPDNGSTGNFTTVADGALYMAGNDGNLHVFRLGGSTACCTPSVVGGVERSIRYPVFYGLLLGGIAWLAVRRRRRPSSP